MTYFLDRSSVYDALKQSIYDRLVAKAEKSRVLHGLSRSLKEMAAGDVRPIDDVIREAKQEEQDSNTTTDREVTP